MVPAKAWVRAHAHITRRTSVECVDSTHVDSTFRLGGELDGRMIKLSVEACFGWWTLDGRTTTYPGVATTTYPGVARRSSRERTLAASYHHHVTLCVVGMPAQRITRECEKTAAGTM